MHYHPAGRPSAWGARQGPFSGPSVAVATGRGGQEAQCTPARAQLPVHALHPPPLPAFSYQLCRPQRGRSAILAKLAGQEGATVQTPTSSWA